LKEFVLWVIEIVVNRVKRGHPTFGQVLFTAALRTGKAGLISPRISIDKIARLPIYLASISSFVHLVRTVFELPYMNTW
jgi:hypothetical protein